MLFCGQGGALLYERFQRTLMPGRGRAISIEPRISPFGAKAADSTTSQCFFRMLLSQMEETMPLFTPARLGRQTQVHLHCAQDRPAAAVTADQRKTEHFQICAEGNRRPMAAKAGREKS